MYRGFAYTSLCGDSSLARVWPPGCHQGLAALRAEVQSSILCLLHIKCSFTWTWALGEPVGSNFLLWAGFVPLPKPGVSLWLLGMESCSYLCLLTSARLIVVFASQKQLSSIIQHNPFHGCASSALSPCHNPGSSSNMVPHSSLLWV